MDFPGEQGYIIPEVDGETPSPQIDHRSKYKCKKCRGDKKKCQFGGKAYTDPSFLYKLGMVCDGCLKALKQEDRSTCGMSRPSPVTKVAGARRPSRRVPGAQNEVLELERNCARALKVSPSGYPSGNANKFSKQLITENHSPSGTISLAHAVRELNVASPLNDKSFQYSQKQLNDAQQSRSLVPINQGRIISGDVLETKKQSVTEMQGILSGFHSVPLIIPSQLLEDSGGSHKRDHRDTLLDSSMDSSQEDLCNSINRPNRRKQKSNDTSAFSPQTYNNLDVLYDFSDPVSHWDTTWRAEKDQVQSKSYYQQKNKVQGFPILNDTGGSQTIHIPKRSFLTSRDINGPFAYNPYEIPMRRLDKECETIYEELRKVNKMFKLQPGFGNTIPPTDLARLEELVQSLLDIASLYQKAGLRFYSCQHMKTARSVASRFGLNSSKISKSFYTFPPGSSQGNGNIGLNDSPMSLWEIPTLTNSPSYDGHDKLRPKYLDRDASDTWGNRGHHLAILENDFELLREMIVDCRWSQELVNKEGHTPLVLAVKRNKLEMVKLLLDASASPDGDSHCNVTTPLHEAVVAGNVEIARLLIERGASKDKKPVSRHLESPRQIALQSENQEMARLFAAPTNDFYQGVYQLGLIGVCETFAS